MRTAQLPATGSRLSATALRGCLKRSESKVQRYGVLSAKRCPSRHSDEQEVEGYKGTIPQATVVRATPLQHEAAQDTAQDMASIQDKGLIGLRVAGVTGE